ncbi:CobW family GTP-binding protein [Lentilitoribacter sp. EG35]|uniref:CobW family GTP-binding protein n=1 Tax=Lentilitoribacter sp. EG35 TaxID=3234192 RepID=UPI00346074DE
MTLPLTILGGYLGAGKTTLINHLLRNANGQRLGILVNEFGDLPIDADLIEAEDDNIVSLSGGCACCSFGDDLLGAIRRLSELETPLDHLLLEASGVALPGAIAANINLISEVNVQSVVVLVDVETLPELLANEYLSDTIILQLVAADIVVLNKTDLVTSGDVDAAKGLIRAHAPDASVFRCAEARVAPALIMADCHFRDYVHGGDHHSHLTAQNLDMRTAVNPQEFARKLAQDNTVLRAKGHILSDQDHRNWTLQLVGKRFHLSLSKRPSTPGVVVIRLQP